MDKKKIYLLIFLCAVLIFYVLYNLTLKQSYVEKKDVITQKTVLPSKLEKSTKEGPQEKFSIYELVNLKDPFQPQIIRKELNKGLSPLESYDIEELKLMGIVRDNRGFSALIKTPDGRHFVVREKDKIGLHGGHVSRISNDNIEIKEYTKSYTGEVLLTKKILKLRSEE